MYHIEKNSVQETLIIPLFGRLICSEHYPELFSDPSAARICAMLDYDFSEKRRLMESQAGLFGALEVAQRQYDLMWEVRDYLKTHPKAAVVNLGCGLDDTFSQVDNGWCLGYNLDMADVISVRNELLTAGEREENIGIDLNDHSWMERIDASGARCSSPPACSTTLRPRRSGRCFRRWPRAFPARCWPSTAATGAARG